MSCATQKSLAAGHIVSFQIHPKLMCATSLGKLCASDHAMNAVDEMDALNRDLKRFFDAQGAEYPVWQALERECGKYLGKQ